MPAGHADHGGVVGGHRLRRDEQPGAELVGERLGPGPQDRAGRHPAHDGEGRVAELLERPAQLGDQHVHAGGDEGRRHLGLREAGVGAHVVDHRRLEPREGEGVAVGEHRPGEAEHVLAGRGQPVEHRAARVAESEEAGHLVVGLADGVVDGLAEQLVAPRLGRAGEHAVPARDQQRGLGERHLAVGQVHAGQVALQVVDAHHRDAPAQRQRLGRRDADQQRADQARART